MAFTTSVLLIPGEKYKTLTTSDSGWFYGIAREIEANDGMVENYPLSHAPTGVSVYPGQDQGQPLLLVMIYRGIHAIDPSVTLMDVSRYWGPLLFALVLIPIFLIGRELAGNWGGCAASFFTATLGSSIYWSKFGAFDRETIQLLLAAWVIFLAIRMFKARGWSTLGYGFLGGLVYGIFGLTWGGFTYLAPVVIGGLILFLIVSFFGRLIRREVGSIEDKILATLRTNLPLILSVVVMFGTTIGVMWIAGISPRIWGGFARTLLSYVGIGAVGGISFTRYAGEMATPTSWSEVFNRFYMHEALTNIILILLIGALIYIVWTRKRHGLLVFPWLLILAGLVWPGKGQIRFERMWWPLIPVLAGVGVAALVALFRRFSSMHELSNYLRPIQNPVVIALCFCLFATPFISNAQKIAGQTTPPTEWHGRGLDEGFMDAFAWLRENTPENSVVAIEWSFGHLLTGTANRATVCDGCESRMEEGTWENKERIAKPPDYIYFTRGNKGYIYGMDVSARPYQINGRRIDVQRLPTIDEGEFKWILSTYRDNYGCKIDYVILDAAQYISARNYYYNTQPANILLSAERLRTERPSWTIDGQNYVFNFGENRENIVLDTQAQDVYFRTNHENLHLDGYGILTVDAQGMISGFGGFSPPPSTVDIPETLLIFLDSNMNMVSAWLIRGVSSEITSRPIPMGVRIFTGELEDINYLQIAHTSSNGLVNVVKVIHENMP